MKTLETSKVTAKVTTMVSRNQSRILVKSVLTGTLSYAPLLRSHALFRRADKLITDTAHRLDKGLVAFQFLAQMADMHVHRPVERRCLASIKLFHQFVAGNHPARESHQRLQNIE